MDPLVSSLFMDHGEHDLLIQLRILSLSLSLSLFLAGTLNNFAFKIIIK